MRSATPSVIANRFQGFVSAIVTVVGELHVEHVEWDRARMTGRTRAKDKTGVRIDKLADEPGGTDPVDLRSRASQPNAPLEIFSVERGRRAPGGRFVQRCRLAQDGFHVVRGRAGKVIDRAEVLKLAAQLFARVREPQAGSPPVDFRQLIHRPGQRDVVQFARLVEEMSEILIRHSLDLRRPHERRFAPAVPGLLCEPLETLKMHRQVGKDVGGRFKRKRANFLELPPEGHPQSGLLRGQGVKQNQPAVWSL